MRKPSAAGKARGDGQPEEHALTRGSSGHTGVVERNHEKTRLLGSALEANRSASSDYLAHPVRGDHRSLSLYCLNTGERLQAAYFVDGRYESDCLREIDHLLRDFRTGDVQPIDPGALDLLYAIRTQLDTTQPLHIVCGFRSQLTNFLKRLTSSGVAEHSYHLKGQAIDFLVPGRPLRDVRMAAVSLRGGGVGYYPFSGFVHVDTGPVRYW